MAPAPEEGRGTRMEEALPGWQREATTPGADHHSRGVCPPALGRQCSYPALGKLGSGDATDE